MGGYRASAFGEFQARITIDDHEHRVLIRVVPDRVTQHGLLLGTDFLSTVDVSFKRGSIMISPSHQEAVDSETCPEIFAINVMDEDVIDVSGVQDIEHKRAIINLIKNYEPDLSRETDVKMTIILKDVEPIYQKARRLS